MNNNYKKITFWATVVVVIAALAIAGVRFVNTNVREKYKIDQVKGDGFAIYLVKNDQQLDNKDIPINDLILEDTPIISKSDISSYNWDNHTIKLKEKSNINRELLKRSFVVMADGKRIYQGYFWSAVFSMYPPKIAMYIDHLKEDDKCIYLPMAGTLFPAKQINSDVGKIISDKRIKRVLERDNILFKPYQPSNFPRPDYIDVSLQGTNLGFANFDWELKDRIFEELDKRVINDLNIARTDLPKEEVNVEIIPKENIISLGYNDTQKISVQNNKEKKQFEFDKLIMPLTGTYSDLLVLYREVRSYKEDYPLCVTLGTLEKYEDLSLIKQGVPPEKMSIDEPKSPNIVYNTGKPFEYIKSNYYILSDEDTKLVKRLIALSPLIKSNPPKQDWSMLCLRVKYGTKENEWFNVAADGKSLITENFKYYNNPELHNKIIEIAEKGFGFKIYNPSDIKDIQEAKYSIRTNTRTVEVVTKDTSILHKIEEELQKAKFSSGGGCPFSSNVLTLILQNGKVLEFNMASDSCPLMFIDGCFLSYSKELHDILESTFINNSKINK